MAAPMKTMVLRGCASSSSVVRSCSRATFSTLPARPMPLSSMLPLAARATSIASTARFFSRTPLQHNAAAAAAPSTAALDWNSFFQLRVKRRRIQMVFSLASGVLGGGAGAVALSSGAADSLIGMVPLDPFVTLGIATLCAGGLGWLIGPILGSQVFYLLNRRYKTQMLQKESEFLTRVKKHRSDPTQSSTSNPVPDYYGEKISSVAGYRRWLKDQRAFNRKKNANFV
ncbi:presequence translocase-associated motor subunit Pam17, putative [Cordyceps militaris CM01]|uniref:Presequence translocated-associated motor subunit PAM17 n=1 Tax=Cordyceps militaris (strain CM01) TaxID=983644 RepID=G3JBB8_CORMM|nr:presequence translocase-associated motor subunit Pam17, putative [Cordyceps militaris CM01]EGX95276.1 presequence translocase-associated motor subunit Pam17, putative [Cordyceps militaris CM01]